MRTRQEIIDKAKELGFVAHDREVKEGETYIAWRNEQPKLLTCAYVNKSMGWVEAKELGAYSYCIWECVPVTLE